MSFYDLDKGQRIALVAKINANLFNDLSGSLDYNFRNYFNDEDTYIRKAAYLETGKIFDQQPSLRPQILLRLKELFAESEFRIRQTVINAAGEIGIINFDSISQLFDSGLIDEHHAVRNAVIGSIKKMGEKNPVPVIGWCSKYINHHDKEIRREICHGLELRGRKYPEEILPLLKSLQNEKTARVRNTLIHVIGQISYKKGCLEKVISEIVTWENKQLVNESIDEILSVHIRYANFSFYTPDQVLNYIKENT